MKITCSMAEDLLPLYLEDMCSDDSRAALEEHLRGCPACREKLERMRSGITAPEPEKPEVTVPIAGYASKIKRRRVRLWTVSVLSGLLAVIVLSLSCLAVIDMRRLADPIPLNVETGVYDLSAGELESTGADIVHHVLATNYERIRVTAESDVDLRGTVTLRFADRDGVIQTGHVEGRGGSVVFVGLSSAYRYRVVCENMDSARITVSDGRVISFWSSLWNVVVELIGL